MRILGDDWEAVQSPNDVWHICHEGTDKTLCGVDLNRAHAGPWQNWTPASVDSFVSPSWGKRCKKCWRTMKRQSHVMGKFLVAIEKGEA